MAAPLSRVGMKTDARAKLRKCNFWFRSSAIASPSTSEPPTAPIANQNEFTKTCRKVSSFQR